MKSDPGADTREHPALSPPILETRGITKMFAQVVAVRDVSVHLNHGEIVAILGENGAGKTTLMNILFGSTDRRRDRCSSRAGRWPSNPRGMPSDTVSGWFTSISCSCPR